MFAEFVSKKTLNLNISPTAESFGLSQSRHWGTLGQSCRKVPQGFQVKVPEGSEVPRKGPK